MDHFRTVSDIWGGRAVSGETDHIEQSQLTITSAAANGVIVAPCRKKAVSSSVRAMFISDDEGHLHPLKGHSVVIELRNGKTLEVLEDYAKKGLLVWGGREPIPGLPLEKAKVRSQCLGIYPVASNILHIFPFKV